MNKALSLVVLFAFIPLQAQAQDATAPDASVKVSVSAKATDTSDTLSAADQAKSTYHAFKEGRYREAIAGVLMLLVFVWRRFLSRWLLPKLSSWWVGLVTVLLGFIASIPAGLTSSEFAWSSFVWHGLLTSAEAMLLWQMLGKKVLPKVFGSPKEG